MWQLIAIVFASHYVSSRGGGLGTQAPTLRFAALQHSRSRLPRYFAVSILILLTLFAALNIAVAIDRSAQITPFIAEFSGVVHVAAARLASGVASASSAVQEAITPRAAVPAAVAASKPVAVKPRARVAVYWKGNGRPASKGERTRISAVSSSTLHRDIDGPIDRAEIDSAPFSLLSMALASPPALEPDTQTDFIGGDGASVWPVLVEAQLEAAALPPAAVAERRFDAGAGVRYVGTPMGRVEIRDLASGAQEWRYPADGKFDAVVVGSSGAETIPDAHGLLSGYPVQSVYLALGSGKEWVIQYSATDNAWSPLQNGMIVSLPRPAKVDPPWPLVLQLPSGTGAGSEAGTLLHAVLDASGRFSRVGHVSGRGSELYANALLPYLERWQFRPAQRAGIPVEIQLLLLAPSADGPGQSPQVGFLLRPSVDLYALIRRPYARS